MTTLGAPAYRSRSAGSRLIDQRWRALRRASRAAAAMVALVGALVLLGWQLDLHSLRAIGPLDVVMNPLAALPGPATILYVEDNLANLDLMESLFDSFPAIRLIPALQGKLALELARNHGPDLILLDLHLPDISGEVVLERLLADPRTRSIPVLIVSADATPSRILDGDKTAQPAAAAGPD